MLAARLIKVKKPKPKARAAEIDTELESEEAKTEPEGDSKHRGFYRYIDSTYHFLLRFSMATGWLIVGHPCTLAFSPRFFRFTRYVGKNFLPVDDQSHYEVSARAPEGSLASSNYALQDVEKDRDSAFERADGVASVGGSFLGAVNQGEFYGRRPRTQECVLAGAASTSSLVRTDPLTAFRNNYSQDDVMTGHTPTAPRLSRICAVATVQSVAAF